jgi:hypothetical protein
MLMKSKQKVFPIAIAIVAAASLLAGGFAIEIAKPSANPEALAKHAVLVARGYACTAPEKTAIEATAEGLVNGKRETVRLKLIPLSGPGMYALTRQWPAEGSWIITLVGANPNFKWQPSVIVQVDGETVDWARVTRLSHAPTKDEIETALNGMAKPGVVASRF